MAPPRRFTPEEMVLRRREQDRERVRKAKALGRTCRVSRCSSPTYRTLDYCHVHAQRKTLHGSVLAGTVAAIDTNRMQKRVSALLDGYGHRRKKKLDEELVKLVLSAIEKLVVFPGTQPLPVRKGKKDAEFDLATELQRLQNPPARLGAPARTKNLASPRRLAPVTAREVFVAAASAWLLALTPGALTRPAHLQSVIPVFDTPDAIALLIGTHVFRLRRFIYKSVYDEKRGLNVVCPARRAAARRVLAKKLIAQRLMKVIGPLLPLCQAGVLSMMQRSERQREKAERARETLVTKAPPEVTGPSIFTFD